VEGREREGREEGGMRKELCDLPDQCRIGSYAFDIIGYFEDEIEPR